MPKALSGLALRGMDDQGIGKAVLQSHSTFRLQDGNCAAGAIVFETAGSASLSCRTVTVLQDSDCAAGA
eukprot:scaffold116585_cov19-Tisochrysis_lutea.AAC.1